VRLLASAHLKGREASTLRARKFLFARGQSHFVTFCCNHCLRLFTADATRRIFESALERVRRSFRLRVYGDVVMPEHVHLPLSEPQPDTLADALKLRRLAGV